MSPAITVRPASPTPTTRCASIPDEAERLAFWQRWHSHVLGCKAITDPAALRAAIEYDRVVALAAARTLLSGLTTRRLLGDFFADRADLHADLHADVVAVADERLVNHIGFQIREPLDVWLEGLALWAPRLQLDVVGVKRFPASQAFRDRVGAFAEMAQIWIRQDDMTVELELFDIHRPNPARTGQIGQVGSTDSTRALLAAALPAVLRSVVADDDVWHYGVRITTEHAVEHLHEQFHLLVSEDERFRLRSERTVANVWHGSVHTKLTNLELDTEIEFLTYTAFPGHTAYRLRS
jgi:hypothetical protein